MNETIYGKLCRKYRIDKGWKMSDVLEKFGCSQAYLSQVETGKSPLSLDFIVKSMDVYQLSPAEKQNFLYKVLMDIEKVEIPLKNISFQLRPEFIGLLAVVLLRNNNQTMHMEDTQENSDVWKAVRKTVNSWIPYGNYRMP
jgi:transcriptional regulator with XRE-family HTH domain